MYVCETPSDARAGATQSHEWVARAIALLSTATCQLDHEQAAHRMILPGTEGGLLTRHALRVCAYIDSHIADRVLVADLCALVQLSEAHFSRAFKRAFGKSPHAFVIRRRVELAAQYMLQTELPLSDIARQCGFADQAHLCRSFRQRTGHTPAAWRRAHSGADSQHRG